MLNDGRKSLLAHAEKLQALRVLVEVGGFRRAAAQLGQSPSALSQSIATLERHVGQALVVRGSVVRATPRGELVLSRVGPALDAILAIDEPKEARSLPRTKLRLGAYESIAIYALPELLARLSARHPSLVVAIRTGRSGTLAQLVRRGELEAALLIENDLVGKLEVDVLARDQLGLWTSLRVPTTRTTTYAGLAPGADGLPRFYRRFVRGMGLPARAFIECDSFEALRMMAVRGVAPAVLPRRVALRTAGELRQVPPTRAGVVESGEHAICLVSRAGVNAAVREVVAGELRAVLG